MVENDMGAHFLKRLMRSNVDLIDIIESIEDRFLEREDKEFLKIIVESLRKGVKF